MPAQTKSKTTQPTAEQVKQVLAMEAEGARFADQVAKSGLSASQVDRIVYMDNATKRLAEVEVQGMRESSMYWHGAPTLRYMHDGPFAALALLTVDADLAYGEWKPVADAVMLARSDEAAVAVVAEARDKHADRIAAIAGGTWKRPVFGERKSAVEQVVAKVATLTEEERAALLAALAPAAE